MKMKNNLVLVCFPYIGVDKFKQKYSSEYNIIDLTNFNLSTKKYRDTTISHINNNDGSIIILNLADSKVGQLIVDNGIRCTYVYPNPNRKIKYMVNMFNSGIDEKNIIDIDNKWEKILSKSINDNPFSHKMQLSDYVYLDSIDVESLVSNQERYYKRFGEVTNIMRSLITSV